MLSGDLISKTASDCFLYSLNTSEAFATKEAMYVATKCGWKEREHHKGHTIKAMRVCVGFKVWSLKVTGVHGLSSQRGWMWIILNNYTEQCIIIMLPLQGASCHATGHDCMRLEWA